MTTMRTMSGTLTLVLSTLVLAACGSGSGENAADDTAAASPAASTSPTPAPVSTPDAPAPATSEPAVVDLAGGDAAAGEKTFRMRCAVCHRVGASSGGAIGPHLDGVMTRNAGSLEGFAYSAAMKAQGKAWTPETLDGFLKRPQGEVPGTRMAFGGLADARQRADVIAYLKTAE